jgi:hypothetical protein
MSNKPSFQATLRTLAVYLSTIHLDSIFQQSIKRKYVPLSLPYIGPKGAYFGKLLGILLK